MHREHYQGLISSDEEFDSLLNDIPTTAEFTKTILDDLTKRYDSCRSKYEHDQTAYEEGYCDALDYAMCKLDDFYDLFQPDKTDKLKIITTMNETITIECWIARDSDGELNLFGEKPILKKDKGAFGFSCWDGKVWYLEEVLNRLDIIFPNLTYKNSPIKCEITIKTKE